MLTAYTKTKISVNARKTFKVKLMKLFLVL